MVAYNIFRKTPDTPLAWVATAVILGEAKKRLISLASAKPGDYFIWNPNEYRFIEPFPKSA